jgi:hypothetical protein
MDQAAVAPKSPAYLDGHFAQVAMAATIPQLRLMVRAARPISLTPDVAQLDAESSAAAAPGEWLWCQFDDDGRYHVRGEFDADHGRVIDAALSVCRDSLFHAGQRTVSWSDALVEMAEVSIDRLPAPRRDKFRVNWFVDPTDPVPARWSDGLAIPNWLRDRTRRRVLRRDGKCRVPGCTQTRWLPVHDVVHQAAGGGHDTANLVALCPHDHRLHHRGQLGIIGNADDPDGLVFTDADGRVIDPRYTRRNQPGRHRRRPVRITIHSANAFSTGRCSLPIHLGQRPSTRNRPCAQREDRVVTAGHVRQQRDHVHVAREVLERRDPRRAC